VDFELSDDQVALRDGVVSLLEGRFDMPTVRSMRDQPGAVDRDMWTELAETGVFSLALSEDDGGLGLGWADTAIVYEQLGRFAVPGPLVAAAVCAGLIDGVADGSTIVGLLDDRADTESATVIEHAAAVDLVVAVRPDGVDRIELDAVELVFPDIPLDALSPVGVCSDLPAGQRIADGAAALRLATIASTLTAALQLGLATGATELAVAYAGEREQFGKVIGQFQAVKHLCADMASRVEVARAAVYFAAVTLDDPEVGDAAHAASVARIVAGNAASANGKDCIQVHGGMGYTSEVDAHLYLKRAWVHETQFGTIEQHEEQIAASM
jgi:alkylation response protein AidB-like acyl-CoA dehydrogenase